MKNIFVKTFFIASILFLQNCSDDVTYDKEKAVLAFADTGTLTVDESLKNTEIKIPKQQNFDFSAGFESKNQQIENFYFSQIKPKKFLNKSSTTWSGSRPFFGKSFVFEPAITSDKIFLLDARGNLFAYDIKTKKKIFKNRIFAKRYLKNYQTPKISYFNDTIYAIAGSNEIVASNAIDGKILWSKTILSLPVSKPVSDGKLVYTTTSDNKTYALNATTGELVWTASGVSKPTAILGSSNPIIYKENLIVSYASGEIYALDKNTGEPLWSQNLNVNKATDSDFYLNDIDATPIIKNNIIFAIGNGGLMMAIDIKTGNYLWKKEIATITDFFAASEFLFVIDNHDKLIALSQKNGAIKYISQLPDYKNKKKSQSKIIYNGIILAGNKLIISDSRGRLLVAALQDGKIEQEFKINQKIFHSPIVVNGKIYLHTVGSFLINLVEVW